MSGFYLVYVLLASFADTGVAPTFVKPVQTEAACLVEAQKRNAPAPFGAGKPERMYFCLATVYPT